MYNCSYYDLRKGISSTDIDLLFPGWQSGDERVAVLSPHDDDAALGAGYLMLAAQEAGAEVWVLICCDGRAGYSAASQKHNIIPIRKRETLKAHDLLGIPRDRVVRFDFPDYSLMSRVGWELPGGSEGTTAVNIRALRRIRVTRLLVPNGYREHIDHTAAWLMGSFDGPQMGDPTLVDFGHAEPIRSTMVYSVWADFDPEDSLVCGASPCLRANRALVAPVEMEERVGEALRAFESQGRIIEGLMAARRGRFFDGGAVELYQAFDARPRLNYSPYQDAIRQIGRKS